MPKYCLKGMNRLRERLNSPNPHILRGEIYSDSYDNISFPHNEAFIFCVKKVAFIPEKRGCYIKTEKNLYSGYKGRYKLSYMIAVYIACNSWQVINTDLLR